MGLIGQHFKEKNNSHQSALSHCALLLLLMSLFTKLIQILSTHAKFSEIISMHKVVSCYMNIRGNLDSKREKLNQGHKLKTSPFN